MIILAIQSTYAGIEIGLYNPELAHCIDHTFIAKDQTSTLLSAINRLLTNAKLAINNISYCIVNRGPAPFTTLRTVIATANGLKAAACIPLIGLSGLDLLSMEYNLEKEKSIILLNAFAGDFYFYINETRQGIGTKEEIKTILQKDQILTIIGNGGTLIKSFLPQEKNWQFIDSEKGACTLNTLAIHGYQKIIHSSYNTPIQAYVTPLYFKEVVIF